MTQSDSTFPEAAAILAERDPVLRRLVSDAGPPRPRPPAETHFVALVRAVVYQQLAGPAAAAIFGRLTRALGDDVTPERLLSLPDTALRSAGLSGRKATSLRDLAAKVLDGTVVLEEAALRTLSDDEVIAALSSVIGIGAWTAQMFLIFQLLRMDVWPTGDLGIRKGYGLAWNIPTPTAKQLEPLGDPYRPYRTVLAWYCWQAARLYGGAAGSVLTGRPGTGTTASLGKKTETGGVRHRGTGGAGVPHATLSSRLMGASLRTRRLLFPGR